MECKAVEEADGYGDEVLMELARLMKQEMRVREVSCYEDMGIFREFE
ncbi:MAG: hypothetical protein ACI4TB_04965 [Lachnospiraceae bacterium]